MKKDTVLLPSHYLPCIEYFIQLLSHDHVVIEAKENYQKQTFRNRCIFPGANKLEILSVPVKSSTKRLPIREVEIDYTQQWVNIHKRAIQSAYGKSPYYEYFIDYFTRIYEKKHKYLFDLNMDLLTHCLQCLQIKVVINQSVDYLIVTQGKAEGINDMRDGFDMSKPVSEYHEHYMQVFGRDFVPNMSIIDLIFCEGPNAASILLSTIASRTQNKLTEPSDS